MLSIQLQGEEIQLLAERALHWPAQKTLIVADLHWGKTAHFRKNGIAIPGASQQQDEIRLAQLIRQYNVERLVIAGDLFHSKGNNEVDSFSHWRTMHTSLHIDLVTGNHDILPAEKYLSWNLNMADGLNISPFFISHDVPKTCDSFCIHGHIHPAIRITGKGNQAIRLSCFCEDEGRLILPAFGQFTGKYTLNADDHKHLYVIADTTVMKWK